MDIVVVSREVLKPSSPTPNHLRQLKFSLIDQYVIPSSVRVVLLYSAQGDVDRFKETNQLKKSLSDILTQFYPIAGTISNNEYIDCNDGGIEYLEARVTGLLSLVLGCPKADVVNQLIPNTNRLSAVQVSIFGCGGMAIGVNIFHKAGDALSLATFISSWAAISRGANQILPPKFGFESLFPPKVVSAVPLPDAGKVRFVSRRFVFQSLKLAALKALCADFVDRSTRVEVVTSLIYRSFIKVTRSRSSNPSVIGLPINLRGRMSPPLPQHSFGNLSIGVTSPPWPTETEPELHGLVGQLRDMIRKIDGDYVEKLQADNGKLLWQHFEESKELFKGGVNVLIAHCCCRFPFYEADFGWGMPTWATRFGVDHPNVSLMDTENGEGIEAWVTLEEGDMTRFCGDKDLLDFACENPMVLEGNTQP